MEIQISPTSKSYATEVRARAEIHKISVRGKAENESPRRIRHIIFPRELISGEVRYHPVALGTDNIDLIHEGIMVIG